MNFIKEDKLTVRAFWHKLWAEEVLGRSVGLHLVLEIPRSGSQQSGNAECGGASSKSRAGRQWGAGPKWQLERKSGLPVLEPLSAVFSMFSH